MTDPNYAAGQVINGRTICGAKKKDLNPCGAPPAKGGVRCGKHGGKSPQALKAAERRLAEQEAQRELDNTIVTLGLPQDVDPAKALLDEIARSYGIVQWLQAKVRELEPDDLVWGLAETQAGIGKDGPIDTKTHRAEFSAWYQLYMTERKHLVAVSAAALKAGVEARRIALAERQGDMVATALRRVLDALNLSPAQLELVPIVVPRELRALAEYSSE